MKFAMKSLTADVLAVAGALCLSGGTWWIYRPAGLLVAGALLLLAAGRIESEATAAATSTQPRGEH